MPLGVGEVAVDPTVAGIALLVFAVALFVVEVHLPTYGIFALLGLASLTGAALLLFYTESDEVEFSLPLAIAITLLIGGFVVFAARKALEAGRGPVHTGWEELVGDEGLVREPLDPVGQVFIEGALWRARLDDDEEPLGRGARVRVESVEGLTLRVRPVPPEGESQ